MSFRPFACRSVGAQQQHEDGRGSDQDEWNHEGNTPRFVRSEVVSVNKRIIDGRHNKVGDTTTGVAQTTSEGIGRANDILVEETSAPYLTGNEAATKDADEESKSQKTFGTGHRAS